MSEGIASHRTKIGCVEHLGAYVCDFHTLHYLCYSGGEISCEDGDAWEVGAESEIEVQLSEDEFSVLFPVLDTVVSKGSRCASLKIESSKFEELYIEWFRRSYDM